MLNLLLNLALGGIYYFPDATVYDQRLHSLREGVDVVVTEGGMLQWATTEKVAPPVGAKVIKGALILPHLSDFYSLIQERGLGLDSDLSTENQGRIARYFKAIGIGSFRDPVFPEAALGAAFDSDLSVLAQRGYLDLAEGAGAQFSQIVNPEEPPETLFAGLPERGPLTLWWTSGGAGSPVIWPEYGEFLRRLIDFAHEQGRKVGGYVQDASPLEMKRLSEFPIDFFEGLPREGWSVENFRNVVWVPLAGLNDKRYCAAWFERRLTSLSSLGLYDAKTLTLAQRRIDQLSYRLRDRCLVWKKRRTETLEPLLKWLKQEGRVAIASGGGHMFSFSGDIRSELDVLDGLGASPAQLLRFLFQETPELLGESEAFLQIGKPANFIVYEDAGYWLSRIGKKVDYNFRDGKLLSDSGINL